MRETSDQAGGQGRWHCPYATCHGTVDIEATGTWGDGRPARYGTCGTCRRPAEIVEGVDQLTLEGMHP